MISPAELERVAATAWPAEVSEERDGWLLRDSPGLRGRARSNAALPLRPDADWAIPLAWAAERSQPRARIQVAPIESHGSLDAALEAAGWLADTTVDVLTTPLAPPPSVPSESVPFDTDRWLEAWRAAEGREDAEAHRGVFRSVEGRAAWLMSEGGEGVGMGVLGGGTLGLFCLATHPDARRQGHGAAVLTRLHAWGASHGARLAWLQVEAENHAAQALYARAGYRRSHGYVQRLAPPA